MRHPAPPGSGGAAESAPGRHSGRYSGEAAVMPRQRGFTLIEIVIAVMITAILFAMAYGAINQAVGNRGRLQENSARLRAVQFAVRSMVQDFSQLTPRPVREPIGNDGNPRCPRAPRMCHRYR